MAVTLPSRLKPAPAVTQIAKQVAERANGLSSFEGEQCEVTYANNGSASCCVRAQSPGAIKVLAIECNSRLANETSAIDFSITKFLQRAEKRHTNVITTMTAKTKSEFASLSVFQGCHIKP
jgi:hypothetical protein